MKTKKKYQTLEMQIHRVTVESHLLTSTGAAAGPSANFMQDPGVGETDD